MIRKARPADLEQLMQIWLNGNLQAHNFVPASYWRDNYTIVKKQLLKADVFVYEDEGKIQGFVGLIGSYVAGIFVQKENRGHGVGTKLLNYVKKNRQHFSLDVYVKNKAAVQFYLHQKLKIAKEDTDSNTDEKEYRMMY